ncbi:uncharacterized membrane protein HdeD (DUF308 family) [Sulfitobacter undariae]|uniref:Uncharacterized membrane protein HdeD (DUF308 family) n=1 Tax=Sulfitobacter undariae TaxID=1563671 RepID=A0A7W6H180_9RHOB|nr:DUF308 domain-containing protein [Sulfitobacter undariae]MBB3994832.1 uncharacterized membrane protein HdeD (DUF308 family) [Sulfitobacter undariae]
MKNWALWLCVGIISLIGGLLALFNPLSASIAATTLAGWALLFVGALQGWSAWKSAGFKARTGAGIAAAASLLMGLVLLFGPFGDGTFLRYALTALLIISGAAKLWAARHIRGDDLHLVVLGAGGVSVLLGLVVLTGFPGFLAGSLGAILGLELMANGAALVVLSLRRRKVAPLA